VQVREQTHGAKRRRAVALLAEIAKTGAEIEDDRHFAGHAHRHARRVAAEVPGVVAMARGRTAHSVERDVDHQPKRR